MAYKYQLFSFNLGEGRGKFDGSPGLHLALPARFNQDSLVGLEDQRQVNGIQDKCQVNGIQDN